MSHLNRKGPEEKGSGTGRFLGLCKHKQPVKKYELGTGMGLRRRSDGGTGRSMRLKSGEIFDQKKKSL